MVAQGGDKPPCGKIAEFALLYPSQAALADAVRRVVEQDWPIDSAEDHGATLSVYLHDPDGNGLELYYDRRQVQWIDENGRPVLKAEPFDWRTLLAEATTATIE